MKVCEKCGSTSRVFFIHVGKDQAKYLCDKCAGHPEYHVDCPHCDAEVAV